MSKELRIAKGKKVLVDITGDQGLANLKATNEARRIRRQEETIALEQQAKIKEIGDPSELMVMERIGNDAEKAEAAQKLAQIKQVMDRGKVLKERAKQRNVFSPLDAKNKRDWWNRD